jgi:4-alpha-glucanotransferase
VTSGGGSATAVAELAALHGVLPAYTGTDGREHRADDEVVLAILGAMGVPVGSAAEVAAALVGGRRAQALRTLEPVLVSRTGRLASATVTLPSRVHPRDVWCTIELESGGILRQRLTASVTGMAAGPEVGGERFNRYRIRLERHDAEPLQPGYHRLVVEWTGSRVAALLVVAPTCPSAPRGWGVFLPLHALRTDEDWGVGSYTDMAALGKWAGEIGGSMLGSLPLYPSFLDPPADPSPYLPVSRLAYNELYVDVTSLPELESAPQARRLLAADEFRRRLVAAHESTLVDYEEVSRLRRQVLAPMAEALVAGSSTRRASFCAFADEHPELVAYARFRAAAERLARPSAVGAPGDDDLRHDEPALAYHLYAQWAAAQQLSSAADSTPIYADLPIGVHPEGFDPRWSPQSFVPGAHGGAPPDLFFARGQDWAFPPFHPERMREDGYSYFISMLQRAFRHAAYVRIDHVMGLERLYWIPDGFEARHGAYVSYRADELHALVALEAHRSGVVIVGEDLGTVPDSVRSRMAEDRMLRSWVLQFESTVEQPLPSPPVGVLASWGTHDLPRFSAYFWGADIDEREEAAGLSPAETAREHVERERWREALLRAVGEGVGSGIGADPGEEADRAAMALRACLIHLARSPADLVLVDLEDLWGERQPQNRPGTGTEAGNWRRRAARTLGQVLHDTRTAAFLRELHRLRQGNGGSLAPVGGVA